MTTSDLSPRVDVYFDFISPYAYLGWQRTRGWPDEGVAIRPIPVVFAGLLQAHGQLGPAEIPAKRRFVIRDCLRLAKRLDVPFSFPAKHPFRSIEALRLCLPEVAGDRQQELVEMLWLAGWSDGLDIGDPDVLQRVLDENGLDGHGLLAKTRSSAAKIALTQNTKAAIGKGVFGVPTFGVGCELIWGHDRLDDVRAVVEGRDSLSPAVAATLSSAPFGVVRTRKPKPDHPRRALVESLFADATFVASMGVAVQEVADGAVTTTMAVTPAHLQQDGYVHAGALATLADHTAGAAAGSVMEPGRRPLSIEFKINMLAPALGPMLRCEAKVLQAGHRIIVAEAWVYGGADEALVAKATVTLKAAKITPRPLAQG